MIPTGYIAFGWHSYPSHAGPASLSAGHLAHDVQGEYPYRAICGAECRGRKARRDKPALVASELERGERTLCKRCANRVA